MRCSWFESHFGRYLDGTLAAPKMRRVAAHLESCTHCSALIVEIDVVDALLVTTKTPPLPPDFTCAVMSDVRNTPLRTARRFSPWPMLGIYLLLAWIAATIALRIPATHAALAGSWILAMRTTAMHGLQAIVGATHAIAPATPLFVVSVLAILALDTALIWGLIAHHRKLETS